MDTATHPAQLDAAIADATQAIEAKIIAWRRDIHQHPELGNREFRTAKIVADHLRALGFDEVREKVAHTGVVGVLRGGEPGPAVALRADMDALPVTEEVDVPFRSTARAEWNGQTYGVMHACGHDLHTAILMGVAEVLAGLRAQIPGSVTFLFQPAEEGTPAGEEGGARRMVEQGCLRSPDVGAIFALHVTSSFYTGEIAYRPGPMMASVDDFRIVVRGRQTHAAAPWAGIDPIVVGSQIVMGLQTIVARRMDITREPSIVTVGVFRGGARHNILPEDVFMEGTIRAFDEQQREAIHTHVRTIAEGIAGAGGASANVVIQRWNDVSVNDPELAAWSAPILARIAGEDRVHVIGKAGAGEDFSFYQKVVPGFYYLLGCTPADRELETAAPNHSPRFFADEACLALGVKTLCALALDWLSSRV